MIPILVLFCFLLLVAVGVPVFVAMGIGGLLGMFMLGETSDMAQNMAFTVS